MRLLDCDNDQFRLIKAPAGAIPRYAILSHTWDSDSQEVTFRDLIDGTGMDKTGYEKIRFCATQARRDGLRYIWVDTCCIDKANNTELAEAINSMYRWYQNAARCYAYLSDISDSESKSDNQQSQPIWESALRRSKWFTRGWTLQELLAPTSVEFFAKNGVRLGDKRTLERQIQEITNIGVQALRGNNLSMYSVEERFKWAETRQTTLEEDWAYCLLGIFGIFMPLIYGEGKTNAIRRLKKEIADAKSHDDGPSSQTSESCTWIVPFERNPSFTSRESDLTRLRQMLFPGQHTAKVAISGLGGVGKTQLALELVYRIKDDHKNCSVIWIPATSKESLGQAYRNAAAKLGISGYDDAKADVKRLVQNHLSSESAGQWLLVFDNADEIGMWVDQPLQESSRLIDYMPRSVHGSIIFTTRDKKAAIRLAGRNVVELSAMNEEDGKKLLEKCLVDQEPVSQQDVAALLIQLMYLPLAIVQAAVYINTNGISLGDYLSLLEEQEEDVIDLLSEDFEDDGRYDEVKNPIATTWLISFEQIRHRDPLAADYLSFMACVDAKDIPQSLLPPGQSRKQEMEAMGTLQGYSFIAKRSVDSAVTVHRLVHLAMRNWLRKEGLLSHWAGKTIAILAKNMGSIDYDKRTWRSCMPHAHYVLGSPLISEDDKGKLDLLRKYAKCLYYDGRYQEAESVLERVTENLKMKLGDDHPEALRNMSNLASTYRRQGRWKEAEKLDLQAVEGLEKKLGVDHPDTLISMGNLALTYRKQSLLEKAAKLQEQVTEGLKTKLGADHQDTLIGMINLASTYKIQGRIKEAERLELRAIEGFKAELGIDHPDTLIGMNNLAITYRRQNRWEEAEELQLQLVEICKKKLGTHHPDTLHYMRKLAILWKDRDRQEDALRLMQTCYDLQQTILGASHPRTLATQSTLRAWQKANK
ncbi:heterokaryon incompatibility protein domain-containing protein [Trichoderma sp. SZMC 28013]